MEASTGPVSRMEVPTVAEENYANKSPLKAVSFPLVDW